MAPSSRVGKNSVPIPGTSRALWRGLLMGLAIGFPLAALFASYFGGEGPRITQLGFASAGRDAATRAAFGGFLGLALGVATCMAGSAFVLLHSHARLRETVREETRDEPTVKDQALGRLYPGLFGSADPYEPMRRRIEQEEPEPAESAPPRAGPPPSACLACGKELELKDEPGIRFCYHCGAPLT